MLKAKRAALWAWLFFSIASMATISGGFWHYTSHRDRYILERQEELRTIGELRVEGLQEWRRQRLQEAKLISSGLVGEYVRQGWAAHGGDMSQWEAELKQRLKQRLLYWVGLQGYEELLILGLEGTLLASSGAKTKIHLDEDTAQMASKAATSGVAHMGEVYVCDSCKDVHLDVAAPITDAAGKVLVVLVTRLNPRRGLFPQVQRWPTPSSTAETLLAQGSDDHVVLLNTLRHSDASPMSLSFPLSRSDLPAVRAVIGDVGPFQGRDYRGVEVMAHLSPVPNSPWRLVSKIDLEEVMRPLRTEAWLTLAVVVVVILALAALTLLLRLSGKFREEHLRVAAERARRLQLEEVRVTLYSIGDAVIATDAAGSVSRMNQVAEHLTGWSERDAVGKALTDVFRIVNEESGQPVESPVERVLREKKVVGLANHTLLISADGTRRPIADSGAPILDDEGTITGVVLVFRDQTEERLSEEATTRAQSERDTERRNLRSVMDAAPIPLLVFNREGQTTLANEAAHRVLGPQKYGTLARRCGDYVGCVHRGENDEGCGHSPSCPQCALYNAICSVTSGGHPVHNVEVRILASSGSETAVRWFMANVEPLVLDGQPTAVMSLAEITARKVAELNLIESEQRLRRLYEESPLGYHSLDASGVLLDVNPCWSELLGYTREEVLGRPFGSFVLPEDLPLLRERFAQFKETRSLKGAEYRLLHKNGQVVHVAIDGRFALNPDGTNRQTHCVLRDITDEKKEQAERRSFEAALRQQQKLESLGTLASGVAHEINNPLNVVMNYAQIIHDGGLDEPQVREFAGNIVRESERMALIVRNLLSFARRDKEAQGTASVTALIEHPLSLMQSLLRKDGIELRLLVDKGLPDVRCRSQQIQQVLMNLVTNARDAVNERHGDSKSGKSITIEARELQVGDGRRLRVSVSDTGTGIRPEVAPRVFDPFFTTKARDRGTGLGLSVSYGILKDHGGELSFQTVVGEGTVFHMDLPIE